MPYDQVMSKWKRRTLHSGSKSGPKVRSHAQAVAIMLSEKRKADAGKTEYQPKRKRVGADTHPNALSRKRKMYVRM